MKKILLSFLVCASFALATTHAQIEYSEDFESLDAASPSALGDAGWLVGANVTDAAGNFIYNYFAFPAPNGGPGFSSVGNIDLGPNNGLQYINTYSDYNNGDHANPDRLIEAIIFQERPLTPENLGLDYTFTFDYRTGNAADDTPAGLVETEAFVKVIDPNNGFATVHFKRIETSTSPTAWTEGTVITDFVDPAWAGMIIQWGFSSTATNYAGTGVFYDNLSFVVAEPPVIPTMGQWALFILGLMITTLGVVTIRRQAIA